jgi:uncharacterized membrane protein YhaH (DUF805 family)
MTFSDMLFSFSGRLNRARYWLTILGFFAVSLACSVISLTIKRLVGVHVHPANLEYRDWSVTTIVVAGLFILIMISIILVTGWIALAVVTKRLHDRDKSAWWLLLFYFVPPILEGIGRRADAAGSILILIGLGYQHLGIRRNRLSARDGGAEPLRSRPAAATVLLALSRGRPMMQIMRFQIAAATSLLGCFSSPTAGTAASFDCGQATSAPEKTICADLEISTLDATLAESYGLRKADAQRSR